MSKEIKRIDLNEFVKNGYLQEANRLFFHPLGLALEVIVDGSGNVEKIGGIWDYTDDPEGMFFYDASDIEFKRKSEFVKTQMDKISVNRLQKYGFNIQPVGHRF